jgi:hypothetical protein
MLLEKFRSCLSIGLDAKRDTIDALADRVLQLDQAQDVAAIVSAFPA